jgi:hypothetical protein
MVGMGWYLCACNRPTQRIKNGSIDVRFFMVKEVLSEIYCQYKMIVNIPDRL